MSYRSFRQKRKIHGIGALRTNRGEKSKNKAKQNKKKKNPASPAGMCQAFSNIVSPPITCSFFPFLQSRKQVSWSANHPKTATNHHPSWDSTPGSVSCWQGLYLTIFYYSSATRINKLNTIQENKGIMRLCQAGVMLKKKK